MSARRFNKLISVYRIDSTGDGFSGYTVTGTKLVDCWAEIKPVNKNFDLTDFGLNKKQLVVNVTVYKRNDFDYDPLQHFIRYNGDDYNIVTYAENVDFDNRYIRFMAVKSDTTLIADSVLYGPEQITNGSFDTDTDWLKQGTWQVSGGTGNTSAPLSAIGWIYQTKSGTYNSGLVFKIEADIVVNASSCQLGFGSNVSTAITSSGNYSFEITLTANQSFAGCKGASGFDGSVDNISVKEVL